MPADITGREIQEFDIVSYAAEDGELLIGYVRKIYKKDSVRVLLFYRPPAPEIAQSDVMAEIYYVDPPVGKKLSVIDYKPTGFVPLVVERMLEHRSRAIEAASK